jgi:hypothetical protein
MRRHPFLFAMFAFGILAVVSASVVLAAKSDRRGGGPIDLRRFSFVRETVTTSKGKWTDVKSLPAVSVTCPGKGGLSATLSAQLRGDGAPVQLRLRMTEIGGAVPIGEDPPGRVMQPGRVSLITQDGFAPTLVSFEFVAKQVPGDHGSVVEAQWRSLSGQKVELDRATLVAFWNDEPGPCA